MESALCRLIGITTTSNDQKEGSFFFQREFITLMRKKSQRMKELATYGKVNNEEELQINIKEQFFFPIQLN